MRKCVNRPQTVRGVEAVWPFGRLFKTRLPLLAPRPQISGEKKVSSSYNCFDTHAHTRQTNHYIAHLQVYYQTDTTVHTVEIRPLLWCLSILFFLLSPPFTFLWQNHFFQTYFPHILHFFLQQQQKIRGGDIVDDYFVDRMRATMSPYRPKTSAKIRMRIMPTNNLGC